MDSKRLLQRWVVIDDEIHLRLGLQKLFKEHAPYWSFAGEAKNGEDGWALIKRVQPELAIVDIRMPIMSGIELARLAQEHQLPTQIVILTGYKDFEYAQAAVKFGVVDFLLKPVRPLELLKVAERLHHLRTRRQMEQRVAQRLRKEEMIRHAILGLPVDPDWNEIVMQEKEANTWWIIRNFVQDSKLRDDPGLLQFAMRNLTEDTLSQFGSVGMYIPIEYNVSVVLIENLLQSPSTVADELGRHIHQYLGMTQVAIERLEAEEGESWHSCYQRYRRAGDATEPWGLKRHEPVIDADTLETMLLYYIERSDYPRFKETWLEAIRQLQTLQAPAAVFKLESLRLYTVIHSLTRKLLQAEMSIELPGLEEMEHLHTQAELIQWVEACFSLMMREIEQWSSTESNQMVERALAYMEMHYADACSLADVAAHVHVSAAYLSDLMKRETGKSFVKTLTDIRMRHAKFLLLNTDLRVADIAAKTGYDDPNYFSALFSKIHNKPPNRYRKSKEIQN